MEANYEATETMRFESGTRSLTRCPSFICATRVFPGVPFKGQHWFTVRSHLTAVQKLLDPIESTMGNDGLVQFTAASLYISR